MLGIHRNGNKKVIHDGNKANIYIDKDDLNWADKEACRLRMNRSEYFRFLIRREKNAAITEIGGLRTPAAAE